MNMLPTPEELQADGELLTSYSNKEYGEFYIIEFCKELYMMKQNHESIEIYKIS